MAVHAFIPGTEAIILLIFPSVICLAGIITLLKQWGHGDSSRFVLMWKKEAFRLGLLSFVKTLVVDVFLFRRVWKRNKYRWLSHMAIFWSFLILGGFVLISLAGFLLSVLDPDGYGGYAARVVANLHLPYDILAYFLLAASLYALMRRIVLHTVRDRTSVTDFFIILSVFIIALTGIVAEWFSGYSTGIGKAFLNWDAALQILRLHLYAVFLLFIMVIPWTRFKHIITVPLLLLARRGGE